MGLTGSSSGKNAVNCDLVIRKKSLSDKVVALAGNPNVGKSTVFNSLTGMNQHTGNWPGKTVANAQGYFSTKKNNYVLVDIPGTYSLSPHSAEEEVARDFICFGKSDAVVVVCDATCLERNLNLVLQTIEVSKNVVVCINLIDEARRKGIHINEKLLSEKLGVPVVKTVARKKKTLSNLTVAIDKIIEKSPKTPFRLTYGDEIEKAITEIEPLVKRKMGDKINSRWLSIKLLGEEPLTEIKNALNDKEIASSIKEQQKILEEKGVLKENFEDILASSAVSGAEEICRGVILYENLSYNSFDRRADKILTSKWAGYPIMLMLLALIFWITITGANYPSEILGDFLFPFEKVLWNIFNFLNSPYWLGSIVIDGMYRVLAWVVSVMLPPMAIFFPLFTLLEDSGYLPRIAYNLDRPFKSCNACGKQSLTMCMGFGCNAAGIIGCRIIDSPRERLLAILTNNFVPCNGKFPMLISLISMFLITGESAGMGIVPALALTVVVLIGIGMTFLTTKILSSTILKGMPSSFALELPSYRRPQIGRVIVRSIFDRTLFVLARAASVAAPCGALIWIMANITIGGVSIIEYCSNFLHPFASFIGLDGVILMAFILGFPANEIVIPIMIMTYMAQGRITEIESLEKMREIFVANGWTVCTAVCTIMFSLLHWPCSTALLTVKKETGSLKWTALAFLIPTISGVLICALINAVYHIFI